MRVNDIYLARIWEKAMADHTSQSIVSIIIPTYQAEATIAEVIRKIPDWITHIIVVNDCSKDKSGEIVQGLNNPRVYLLNHQYNQGVGGAMKTGYQKALELGSDIIVKMDSDGQMDPDYLSSLIRPIEKGIADYTKGNRFLHFTQLRQMPWIRRLGNTVLSFIIKLASGYWNIFDPTNGYTAISKNALSIIDIHRLSNGYFFETSMLFELSLNRIVVKDISIPAIYDGDHSSLSEMKTFFEFPPKVFIGFLRRILYQYYLFDFTAGSFLLLAGVVGCVFGVCWGIAYWIKSMISGIPASTGTVMIAVLPIILGVQFLLQAMVLDIQNIPVQTLTEKDINEE
jgi:dolichol-phosphate mannosyltransferase